MWLQHVQRMDTNRISKQALQYRPKRQRNIGRPGRDGGTNFTLRIKEQETRLTLHEHDDDDNTEYLEKYATMRMYGVCEREQFSQCI